MSEHAILTYLQGSFAEDLGIELSRLPARIFAENMACHDLAQEGPAVIIPVLRQTLPMVKTKGQRMVNIMKSTREIAQKLTHDKSAKPSFWSEMRGKISIAAPKHSLSRTETLPLRRGAWLESIT